MLTNDLVCIERNETKKIVRIAIDCLSLTHLRCAPFGSCNATNNRDVSAFSLFSLFVRVDSFVCFICLWMRELISMKMCVRVCVSGQCESTRSNLLCTIDTAQPEHIHTTYTNADSNDDDVAKQIWRQKEVTKSKWNSLVWSINICFGFFEVYTLTKLACTECTYGITEHRHAWIIFLSCRIEHQTK